MKERIVQCKLHVDVPGTGSGAFLPRQVPVDFHALCGAANAEYVDLATLSLTAEGGKAVSCQFLPDASIAHANAPSGVLCFVAEPGVSEYWAEIRLIEGLEPKGSRFWKGCFALEAPDGRPIRAPYQRMQIRPYAARNGKVHVYQDNRLKTTYHRGDAKHPHYYPLNTADGANLLSLGMTNDPGESHRHHRGLWFGNRDIGGVNFWEEKGEGIVRNVRFDAITGGPVTASMVEQLEWLHGGDVLIKEKRTATFYTSECGDYVFDITMEMTPQRPLTIEKNIFGFIGIRGNPCMEAWAGGGYLLNSEGAVGEKNTFWKPARWCAMIGTVKPAGDSGFAILDHPDNPGHPVHWHTRDDGFICTAQAIEGDIALAEGIPFVLRYRIYVFDAPTDVESAKDNIDHVWLDYAHTPVATITNN